MCYNCIEKRSEKGGKMTVKRRLFISNILMIIIPALVSVLMILVSGLLFLNIFYKQFMDETISKKSE